MERTSKLATARGTHFQHYEKVQLYLQPIKTMEQISFLTKPFKDTFHLTDSKKNVAGISIITKATNNWFNREKFANQR